MASRLVQDMPEDAENEFVDWQNDTKKAYAWLIRICDAVNGEVRLLPPRIEDPPAWTWYAADTFVQVFGLQAPSSAGAGDTFDVMKQVGPDGLWPFSEDAPTIQTQGPGGGHLAPPCSRIARGAGDPPSGRRAGKGVESVVAPGVWVSMVGEGAVFLERRQRAAGVRAHDDQRARSRGDEAGLDPRAKGPTYAGSRSAQPAAELCRLLAARWPKRSFGEAGGPIR